MSDKSRQYAEGVAARRRGETLRDCPYVYSASGRAWFAGWRAEDKELIDNRAYAVIERDKVHYAETYSDAVAVGNRLLSETGLTILVAEIKLIVRG